MRTVTAVAHRGDPYRVRENTLPSLRSALDRGADAVEIDVRLTRDGVPVLLHDATLERLWGHDRPLAALYRRRGRTLTEGGVPTLARRPWRRPPGHRLMIDLPGATRDGPRGRRRRSRRAARRSACTTARAPTAMLAVRAADPAAEIALTWTTLRRPAPSCWTR